MRAVFEFLANAKKKKGGIRASFIDSLAGARPWITSGVSSPLGQIARQLDDEFIPLVSS